MALGLQTSSGGNDFLPICKWDARAGRFFRVDRAQGVDGWGSTDVDLTMDKPKFAIDFGSIETGWLAFTATGPDFRLVPLGTAMPERPSKEHKAGFRVKIAGNALNGVREFSASAKAVLASIDALHSSFEAAPESHGGKVPVVELSGSTPIVTNGPQGKVTSYSPVFTIVSWVDRIGAFGDRTVPAPNGKPPGQTAHPNHVPQPAAHVPPPAQAAAANAVPDEMPF